MQRTFTSRASSSWGPKAAILHVLAARTAARLRVLDRNAAAPRTLPGPTRPLSCFLPFFPDGVRSASIVPCPLKESMRLQLDSSVPWTRIKGAGKPIREPN